MKTQPWQTNNPPQDGTIIVAVARVIWSDEFSTSVDQFVAAILWEKDSSGYEGWHYTHTGLTVARELGDEVVIDWWAKFPKEETAAAKTTSNKLDVVFDVGSSPRRAPMSPHVPAVNSRPPVDETSSNP